MPTFKREKRIQVTIEVPESLYARATATGAPIEKTILLALNKRHPVRGPIKVADPEASYRRFLDYSREYARRKRKEKASQ
jgi:hypothetical protein